jgi:hypothetical protein
MAVDPDEVDASQYESYRRMRTGQDEEEASAGR